MTCCVRLFYVKALHGSHAWWRGGIGIIRGEGTDEGGVALGSEEVTGQIKGGGIRMRRGDGVDECVVRWYWD